jgi:hypothetical protein
MQDSLIVPRVTAHDSHDHRVDDELRFLPQVDGMADDAA